MRDIPFYASFFGSYDIFCKILKKSTSWNDTSIYFVAGGYVTVQYITVYFFFQCVSIILKISLLFYSVIFLLPYSNLFESSSDSFSHSDYLFSLAGQIGWIVSIAPDVVKSTIQTSEVPQGIIETTKQIVASRGIRGLFAGVEVIKSSRNTI